MKTGEYMNAVVYSKYGQPEVLHFADVDRPVPGDAGILVRIHSTTVNRTDCGIRKADPFIVRFFTGLFKPRHAIPGSEFAGEVEAAGKAVRQFRVGDRVFGHSGDKMGAHAEYICVDEQDPVALKPDNLSFDEAAAIVDGATLALTYLRKADLKPGMKVLVYGASGSIGTAGVQLAKNHYGAEVTAVCNTAGLEIVRSLGPDRIIDYTREDFIHFGDMYDVIFDSVGKLPYFRCRRMIKPGGIFFSTDLGFMAQNPFLALWTAWFGSRKVMFPLPEYSREDVLLFKELAEAGKYRPVIDRVYRFEQIIEATKYVETGAKIGNVVITMNQ